MSQTLTAISNTSTSTNINTNTNINIESSQNTNELIAKYNLIHKPLPSKISSPFFSFLSYKPAIEPALLVVTTLITLYKNGSVALESLHTNHNGQQDFSYLVPWLVVTLILAAYCLYNNPRQPVFKSLSFWYRFLGPPVLALAVTPNDPAYLKLNLVLALGSFSISTSTSSTSTSVTTTVVPEAAESSRKCWKPHDNAKPSSRIVPQVIRKPLTLLAPLARDFPSAIDHALQINDLLKTFSRTNCFNLGSWSDTDCFLVSALIINLWYTSEDKANSSRTVLHLKVLQYVLAGIVILAAIVEIAFTINSKGSQWVFKTVNSQFNQIITPIKARFMNVDDGVSGLAFLATILVLITTFVTATAGSPEGGVSPGLNPSIQWIVCAAFIFISYWYFCYTMLLPFLQEKTTPALSGATGTTANVSWPLTFLAMLLPTSILNTATTATAADPFLIQLPLALALSCVLVWDLTPSVFTTTKSRSNNPDYRSSMSTSTSTSSSPQLVTLLLGISIPFFLSNSPAGLILFGFADPLTSLLLAHKYPHYKYPRPALLQHSHSEYSLYRFWIAGVSLLLGLLVYYSLIEVCQTCYFCAMTTTTTLLDNTSNAESVVTATSPNTLMSLAALSKFVFITFVTALQEHSSSLNRNVILPLLMLVLLQLLE